MQLISKSREHTGNQKYVCLHLITLNFQKVFQRMPNITVLYSIIL